MPVPLIRPTAIGVYIYRQAPGEGLEFLQIRRSVKSLHGHSWQTVYGGIEPGETATQAALRELAEETSLRPPHLRRMFQIEYLENFYFRPTDSLLLMPVFAVEIAPTTPILLNHEHDAHRWIPASDIPTAFMWRTQREALKIILEDLATPSPARHFLEIDLPASP